MTAPILYRDMTREEQAAADYEEYLGAVDAVLPAGPPSAWERLLKDDLLTAYKPSPKLQELHARTVAVRDRLHQLALEGGLIAPEPPTVWERLLQDDHPA
ncbi:MAG: hypothetical protein ACHREM_23185 [Polyangiales bacterium]